MSTVDDKRLTDELRQRQCVKSETFFVDCLVLKKVDS